MISLNKILKEDRNLSVRRGCLMAMIPEETSHVILEFSKRLIKDEDLYTEGDEYGRETNSHVTIRYGFLKDLNELEVRQLIKGQKSFIVELIGLDKFMSAPQYDVAMFKVNSPVLRRLNEMSGIYLNECDYPEYVPHITIGYIKKGRFPYVKEGLNLKIPVKTVCYAPISGDKSYFNLDE